MPLVSASSQGDIADADVVGPLVADADAVVNFAAESHVDRSILDPEAFLRTGVIGVHVLLEAVREASAGRSEPVRYLQVSTDEVYGSVEDGHSARPTGSTRARPTRRRRRPASCSSELYVVTHGVDAVVTRGSNTYGPYHHPEKLIPLFVTNAIDDQPLPLYGDGLQRRDWLFVADHAGAIDHVLRHGATGETYNMPGSAEMTNRDVVAALLERLGKPWSLVRTVPDRPGHDRRYALDGSKVAALGWRNRTSFADGLAATVDWYRANEPWWRAAKSGDWDAYYERQYGARLRGVDGGLSAVRVAVTGAGGRLGRALVEALEDAPFTGLARADRLDPGRLRPRRPGRIHALLDRDRPEAVVHAAAWTDVDGCAREPDLARARNGDAVHVLAEATAARGIDLVHVSTNEVFDGRRDDGRGYGPDDRTEPDQPVRRVEARRRDRARRPPTAPPPLAWGSSGPPGCTARPATTSRRRSSPPPSGPAPPASR